MASFPPLGTIVRDSGAAPDKVSFNIASFSPASTERYAFLSQNAAEEDEDVAPRILLSACRSTLPQPIPRAVAMEQQQQHAGGWLGFGPGGGREGGSQPTIELTTYNGAEVRCEEVDGDEVEEEGGDGGGVSGGKRTFGKRMSESAGLLGRNVKTRLGSLFARKDSKEEAVVAVVEAHVGLVVAELPEADEVLRGEEVMPSGIYEMELPAGEEEEESDAEFWCRGVPPENEEADGGRRPVRTAGTVDLVDNVEGNGVTGRHASTVHMRAMSKGTCLDEWESKIARDWRDHLGAEKRELLDALTKAVHVALFRGELKEEKIDRRFQKSGQRSSDEQRNRKVSLFLQEKTLARREKDHEEWRRAMAEQQVGPWRSRRHSVFELWKWPERKFAAAKEERRESTLA